MEVSTIVAEINTAAKTLEGNTHGAREKLLDLCSSLTAKLETPSEMIQKIGWAEESAFTSLAVPARTAAVRFAVDLDLFETLKEADQPLSAGQLAKSSDADPALIARTMKHLAAMKIVSEDGGNGYTSTATSDALTLPEYRDGIIYTYDVAGPSFRNLPSYLKKTKYSNPTKLDDGPFQEAHGTNVPFFAWLGQNPVYLAAFNHYMGGYRKGKASWMDPGFFPVERLDQNLGPEEVLLVDIGGGLGHDLEELRAKHPHLQGRLILQERPE
ncbi:MAG: hypothetical protein Q9191_008014, partial [Dirinaria sp. TL-2023a]